MPCMSAITDSFIDRTIIFPPECAQRDGGAGHGAAAEEDRARVAEPEPEAAEDGAGLRGEEQ